MQRRQFVQAATAVAASSSSRVLGANDRIRAGVIGCGGRGMVEIDTCRKMSGVEVVALADVYDSCLRRAAKSLDGKAEGYRDFRRILDRKDVDVVFVSTPDHWHAIPTILACQAGKDVFCEKPLSHTIHEGKQMVAAARKHRRVVQTGSQQRSMPHFARVVELVRGGHIGQVTMVECWNTLNDMPRGNGTPPDANPPSGLDWDTYLGPAPRVAYNRNRFLWNYRWYWDYSGGWMTDWGAHHLDVIQWAMDVKGPTSAMALGGRYALKDNCETPDTLMTVLEYPGFLVRYSVRQASARPIEGRSEGVMFHGSKGTLLASRSGFEVFPDQVQETRSTDHDKVETFLQQGDFAQFWGSHYKPDGPKKPLTAALNEPAGRVQPNSQERHVQSFLDAVRSRGTPNADVELGHRAATACHLGVIAYRLGRRVRWDAEREQILGDAEAQARLTKSYRAPWTLPAV